MDQRGNLVQQLSSLIDVSVINDGSSLTLTTKQGTALVVDGKSFGLTTALDTSSGTQHIYSQDGSDITGKISGGQLGGLLEARDQSLTSVQTQLDSLASGFSQALNAAQAKGFDLNGAAGGNLFTTVTGAGAGAGMKVAITDPALLAASSDGSTGSNGNLANLWKGNGDHQAVSNGLTPTQSYASLVFQSGSAVSDSTAELNASNTMLQQLQAAGVVGQRSVDGRRGVEPSAVSAGLPGGSGGNFDGEPDATNCNQHEGGDIGIPDTSSTLLNALNVADQAEQTALTQLSTGRRVNVASDDPSAAASQVGLAAQSDSCDQFLAAFPACRRNCKPLTPP